MINIYTTSRYKVKKKDIASFAQSVLERRGVGPFIVNIIFVGKRKMRSIASEYGHGDVAKPVLAFPFNESDSEEHDAPMLGEVYVCYPQAVLLAAEKDKSVDTTINFLIEHGITHILKN